MGTRIQQESKYRNFVWRVEFTITIIGEENCKAIGFKIQH